MAIFVTKRETCSTCGGSGVVTKSHDNGVGWKEECSCSDGFRYDEYYPMEKALEELGYVRRDDYVQE